MVKAIALAFVLIGFVYAITRAEAAPNCNQRAVIVKVLEKKYGEQRIATGTSVDKVLLVEFFMSPEGSFTVIATNGRGWACQLAGGDGLEFFVDPVKPAGKQTQLRFFGLQ